MQLSETNSFPRGWGAQKWLVFCILNRVAGRERAIAKMSLKIMFQSTWDANFFVRFEFSSIKL